MAIKEPKEDHYKDIIKELSIALGKLKINDLKTIIDKYGKKSDSDIADDILEWNTNYTHRDEDDDDVDSDIEDELDDLLNGGSGKKKKKRSIPTEDWIEVNNISFRINWIMRIDRDETYDFLKNRSVYSLIVNKLEEANGNKSQVMYANTEIKWHNKKERDDFYESLKIKLHSYNIRFV